MGAAVATLLKPLGLFRGNARKGGAVRKKARPKALARPKTPAKRVSKPVKNDRPRVPVMVRLKSAGTYTALAAGLLAASLILVAGYQFLLHGPVLGLNRITIRGLDQVTSSQVLNRAGLRQGVSLLALDTGALKSRLEASPWIKTATVRRVLPDELSISIIEHVPVAVVLHQGHRWYVDGSGELFKRLDPGERSRLPVIKSNLGPSARNLAWQPLVKAGQVLRALNKGAAKLGLSRVGSLSLDEYKGIIVHPAGKGPSLILGRAEPGRGFAKLAKVQSDLKAKGLWDRARYIDLRFDERVYVGFNPKAGRG